MENTVQINDIHSLTIQDMGSSGEGIGKINNFTVFVDDAVIGDKVEVKITKLKKNYGIGKVINYIEQSPNRTTPKCSIASQCGGCQIQDIKYEKQLEIKKKMVKDNLERIGGLSDIKVHDVIGMKEPFRYRNKGQFPIGFKNSSIQLGFYMSKSHEIVPCEECLIQHETSDAVLKKIKPIIDKYRIPIYNERTGKGILRHIITKVGYATGEMMLILVTNKKELPNKEALVQEIIKEMPFITSLIQNINTKKGNVILGNKNITLYGKPTIKDKIKDIEFNISPQSFYQINPAQTETLYEKALEYANLTGEETVFDLYCGIGTITLLLAQKAKKVIGVEMVEDAIKDAQENAEQNQINNVEFHGGKVEDVVPKLYEEGTKADVVVIDPPRKGCDETLLSTIVDVQPNRIIYVSCNPSTLARDLKYLSEKGYKTQEVQPVDMFPHTMHTESVCLLKRID